MANVEDKLIDEFIESPEPLVPRVDKHIGKKRWSKDVPMVDDRGDLHTALQTGGVINPLFDAMDALLYATEGKPVDALWSLAATVPVADYFINAKRFTKKVIDPALTNIKKGNWVEFNQKLDILGNTGNYVNPKKITLEGREYRGVKEYIVKTTDDYVSAGSRPAVVVEIHNITDGHKVYQPFYRSTGTGHSPLSKGNWLPFEGIVPTGMTESITIRNSVTGKNWKRTLRGPAVDRKGLWTHRTKDNPLGIKDKNVQFDGWLIKAFKNKHGDMINSSIRGEEKIKRGMPIHEEVDLYLRNIWNE